MGWHWCLKLVKMFRFIWNMSSVMFFVNTASLHKRWSFLLLLLKIQGFLCLSNGIWESCRVWVLEKFVSLLVSQLLKKRVGWDPPVLVHKKPTWPAHTPGCLCLLQKVWPGALGEFPICWAFAFSPGGSYPHSQVSVEKSVMGSTALRLSVLASLNETTDDTGRSWVRVHDAWHQSMWWGSHNTT